MADRRRWSRGAESWPLSRGCRFDRLVLPRVHCHWHCHSFPGLEQARSNEGCSPEEDAEIQSSSLRLRMLCRPSTGHSHPSQNTCVPGGNTASADLYLRYGLVEHQRWTDLEFVLKQIFLVRQLAIETEEFLLLLVEGLRWATIRDARLRRWDLMAS